MKKKRHFSEVRIYIQGHHIEQVINHCLSDSIVLHHIEKLKNEAAVFHASTRHISDIESIAQKYHCEMEVTDPSFYEKSFGYLKRRWGVTVGILLFVIITVLLSQMIWNIEIEGADPPLENKLRNHLQDMGVKIGGFQFLLPDSKTIQSALMNEIEGTTWIGMNKNGTTYHFEVVEQTLPEETETAQPRHLVASKTAVIHQIYAEKGQPVVQQNDLVHENELLISGFIGEGEYARAVAATGKVLGETWYKVTVAVPENLLLQTLTGESETEYEITIFGKDIPVWGFRADDQFSQSVVKESRYRPSIRGWQLPIALKINEYQESRKTKNTSEKSTVEKAKRAADNKIQQSLSPEAEILSEKILHEDTQNGKVKLVIHYQVIEDIKSETPIIQGE
ncbi:sporulation protein YqfD [Salibacterium aidingense]|uniref:sporulation protein YqfD n=1 Tax=Salibacterium aidingense TaxID=384933 RepID=UPI003BEE4B90